MIKKVVMKNLMCSSCASKIENSLVKLPNINTATFNFANQIMLLDVKDTYNEQFETPIIKDIVDSIEDGVITYAFGKKFQEVENKQSKAKSLFFIGIAFFLVGIVVDYFNFSGLDIPLYWIGYLLLSSRIAIKTIKGLKQKSLFNENTLMFIATIAAMALGEYYEAALVIILYTIGEYLQQRAVSKSKDQISSLIDLHVEYANVLEDGEIVVKDPLFIEIGDTVIVKNGEKIPVDGVVIKGITSLNTSALTGESKLTDVAPNDEVVSGHINVGNVIHIIAKKVYKDSTISKMIDLIENSTNNKANTEQFITKFAGYYTPIVTILALLMFLVPSLIDWGNYQEYLYRAATFLVVSCPCALILSIPLSYFAGIGAASKKGILFKGSSFLHMMTQVDAIGIDKTGTLTYGNFKVSKYTDEETLKIAASVEKFSNHPIARSIVESYNNQYIEYFKVTEDPGYGLIAELDTHITLVGNKKLLEKYDIMIKDTIDKAGTMVYVSVNGLYKGYVTVTDTIKETSYETIKSLSKSRNITMLTGDNEAVAAVVASDLGNIDYRSNLLPTDKITVFNDIKSDKFKVYVGDGINDAPLLKQADIGIAMGEGSELAIDVADVVIMNSDIRLLDVAFKIAYKTKKIVYQNIVLTLSIKFLFLFLAGVGISKMWMAIFADVGIALIAVLNSLRIIYGNDQREVTHDKR